MDKNEFIVDGYVFSNKAEATEAENELKGIEYVKERTDMNNPKLVLNVYNKIIDKNLFKTPIGYKFLKELQDTLIADESIDNSMVKNIISPNFHSIEHVFTDRDAIKLEKKRAKHALTKEDKLTYKSKFFNSIVINILLVIAIIAIFIITANSKNTNIINYKSRLDAANKQSEDSLAKWNATLLTKESELNSIEESINNILNDTTSETTTLAE